MSPGLIMALLFGGSYAVDTISGLFTNSAMGKGELNLQKLMLEGQLQEKKTAAQMGRKEEMRTDRLIQQAMKMRRDEQNKSHMMQMLMMLESFNQQKTNSLLGFAGNINAINQAPMGGY